MNFNLYRFYHSLYRLSRGLGMNFRGILKFVLGVSGGAGGRAVAVAGGAFDEALAAGADGDFGAAKDGGGDGSAGVDGVGAGHLGGEDEGDAGGAAFAADLESGVEEAMLCRPVGQFVDDGDEIGKAGVGGVVVGQAAGVGGLEEGEAALAFGQDVADEGFALGDVHGDGAPEAGEGGVDGAKVDAFGVDDGGLDVFARCVPGGQRPPEDGGQEF